MSNSEVEGGGEIVETLLVDTEDIGSPLSPTTAEFLTARSRSYSTDLNHGISESTTSIQKVAISSAGEQFNNTSKVIGDATSVSFKTTTTTTTMVTYGESQDPDDLYHDCRDHNGECSESDGAKTTTKQVTSVEITIGPQHFDLLKLLGTGAFGKVVLVQNRLSKELYAMKVISKKLLRKKNNVQYMKSERQILTKVQHPFLVSLKFAFQSETKLFLVMSFLSGGELFLHLRRRGLILEREVQFYLGEMILAMEFLHHHGIIHRDLKPENVLLRHDGHICITDFGLAKEIGDGQTARTLCGTSEYMAPEMLTRTGYGKAVDWWALGALCYEMLVGKPPFTANNQKELDKKIMFEKFTVPPYLTANANGLLRGMLDKDPTKRLGCAKGNMFNIGGVAALKQHVFFDGFDWVAVEHLEGTPPIDLSKEHYPSSTSTNAASSAKNNSAQIKNTQKSPQQGLVCDDIDEDRGAPEIDTRFFSEEFTTQVLSPSLLEDTFSTHEQTPVKSRSRAGSFSGDQPDDFHDFEYMSGTFQCTTEQLQEYEEMMKIRQQKEAKKRVLRLKREAKQAEEEAIRKLRMEEEMRVKKQRELEEKEQKLKLKLEKERQQRLSEKRRIAAEKERERVVHNVRVTVYQEEMLGIAKKVKNVRKKIRDILDLKEKIAKEKKALDKDQQQKVGRLPELERELAELEREEEDTRKKNPGDLIPPYELDPELAEEENKKSAAVAAAAAAAVVEVAVQVPVVPVAAESSPAAAATATTANATATAVSPATASVAATAAPAKPAWGSAAAATKTAASASSPLLSQQPSAATALTTSSSSTSSTANTSAKTPAVPAAATTTTTSTTTTSSSTSSTSASKPKPAQEQWATVPSKSNKKKK